MHQHIIQKEINTVADFLPKASQDLGWTKTAQKVLWAMISLHQHGVLDVTQKSRYK